MEIAKKLINHGAKPIDLDCMIIESYWREAYLNSYLLDNKYFPVLRPEKEIDIPPPQELIAKIKEIQNKISAICKSKTEKTENYLELFRMLIHAGAKVATNDLATLAKHNLIGIILEEKIATLNSLLERALELYHPEIASELINLGAIPTEEMLEEAIYVEANNNVKFVQLFIDSGIKLSEDLIDLIKANDLTYIKIPGTAQ